MNDKRPVNDPAITDDDALGENLRLLIQYEAFDELLFDNDEEIKEEKRK